MIGIPNDDGVAGVGVPPPVNLNQRPSTPRGVQIKVKGLNTITCTWRDVSEARGRIGSADASSVNSWSVVIASDKTLPNDSSSTGFAESVLDLGKEIDNTGSNGLGQIYNTQYTITTILSGWVVIVGYSNTGLRGTPSTPVHVDLSGNTSITPAGDSTLSAYSIGYTAINNNVFTNLTVAMFPPADRTDFSGWHVHLKGYNGLTQYTELGSQQYYSNNTAATTFYITFPAEGGQGNGTATFSGTGVTRVSGDNFNSAWVGRQIYTLNVATGALTSSSVASFISTSSMTTSAGMAAGTFVYRVMNPLTFTIPSINIGGYRDPNVDHAGVATFSV